MRPRILVSTCPRLRTSDLSIAYQLGIIDVGHGGSLSNSALLPTPFKSDYYD